MDYCDKPRARGVWAKANLRRQVKRNVRPEPKFPKNAAGIARHQRHVPQGRIAIIANMKMKPINVGLLGIGTVGGGTFEVLARNQEEITRRAGRGIVIKMVADKDVKRARKLVGKSAIVTDDAFAVVNHPDIDIVIELIGGTNIAQQLILKAIENGKHVVTANKALLATRGNEIFAAARKHGVMVAFEAAVAGGIPIIKALREGLTANRIEWIAGIINGTSNFILSEMRDKGLSFGSVLKEAQRLGYAESDPTFDIEGIDAAHKLTIMAAISFGIPMRFKDAYTEGISKLTGTDIRYAEELGYRIKLLGITRRTPAGIELRVHPTLIPARRLIANVEGVMNAILVKGDAVGATLYYGAGAGAYPTASAVIADLVDVTRMHTADPEHRVPHLAFQPDRLSSMPILPMAEVETSYYLRMRVQDRPGVLATVTRILADKGISIDAMVQKEPSAGEEQVDIIMLTHLTREKSVDAAIARIQKLPVVVGKVTRIRMEPLGAQ
jgi:homoserine dehydrogenase